MPIGDCRLATDGLTIADLGIDGMSIVDLAIDGLAIEEWREPIATRHSSVGTRQSALCNHQSAIDDSFDRHSASGNRQWVS
jgi:hypothetical protein